MMFKKIVFGLTALFTFSAQANVVIIGTRVIYPQDQKNIIVKLENNGKNAALVQAWLDTGDQNADPKNIKTPFIITPPVSRVEAKSGQSLRITYTGSQSLPQDRESLYYFNLLDIPPKPSAERLAESPNFLQLAIRSRLKFFYRPSNLSITVTDAYQAVKWIATPDGIKVSNQTPYYMSYVSVQINKTSVKDARMVAPFSEEVFHVSGARAGSKVTWNLINDFGGDTIGESILQ